MIDGIDPLPFAEEWAGAWNRRDLEAVLCRFHEDAVFTSPLALRLGFGDNGKVRGKEEIRRYWTTALALHLDLHFEIQSVYVGLDLLVISFTYAGGEPRAEVLAFRRGRVAEGFGTGLADRGVAA